MRTTNTTTAAIVAFCLIGAALFYVGPRLSSDDRDDRFITLATAWGTGMSAASSATMMWTVGHSTDHVIKGGGHWERVVAAKRGDHVVVTVTPSNGDPASCAITGPYGLHVTGSTRCEHLSIP